MTRTAPAERTRAFDEARTVADAILYEGYLLYPYRKSSPKNQVRWQFGVLLPRAWVEPRGPVEDGVAGSTEWWWQQTECLVENRAPTTIRLRVRYLQVRRTTRGIDEAVPREHEAEVATPRLLDGGFETSFGDGAGGASARLRASLHPVPAPFPLHRLRIRVENASAWAEPDQPRPEALRRSLVATHCLVSVDDGSFLSLLEPPEWAAAAARECRNVRTFPVLAGAEGARENLVLSSPIILYDHPRVAPESPGDLHDACEIDEILSLRTMTLTEEEKREARAGDPRAAAIVDRVDSMPPEVMERLHGAVRSLRPVRDRQERRGDQPTTPWWDPGADESVSPETDSVILDGVPVAKGSRVRLCPRRRGTDAHDMFLDGRTAVVEAVFSDVDGSTHLAVTVEDDPSAELHQWYGRYHYYRPEELQPLAPDRPRPDRGGGT